MKFIFSILLVSLCIAKNSSEEKNEKKEPSPRRPPPYYNESLPSIPYYYNEKIEKMKTAFGTVGSEIDRILRKIGRFTCISFKKNKTHKVENSIGINFLVSKNSGDSVSLSNSWDCPTNVSLTNDTYMDDTLLTFYIGIALDIIPEVRRPDRKIDVNVTMDNVKEGYTQYYEITNSSYITYLNDTEFDFRSAMFLGPDFGSTDNKSTYEVLLYKGDQYPSDRVRSFRHNFYKNIFYYYCNGSEKQNNCKYGGYPHRVDENECKCPEHFSGNFCTKFDNDSALFPSYTIPDPLTANKTKQYYSVNLNNTIFYLNMTSEGEDISVTVENITFSKTNCSSFGSFLEVLVREDKGAAGMYLCRNSTNFTLPSLSNEVFFVLNAKNENISLNVSYITVEKKEEEKKSKDLKN